MRRTRVAPVPHIVLPTLISLVGVLWRPCCHGADAPTDGGGLIGKLVSRADAVVLARIEHLEPPQQPVSHGMIVFGGAEIVPPPPKAAYSLRILQCLKGEVDQTEVEVQAFWPPNPSLNSQQEFVGRTVMAFLRRQPDGRWQGTSDAGLLHLIPDDLARTRDAAGTDLQRVIRVVLSAAKAPGYGNDLDLLRGTRQPGLAAELRVFTLSADLHLRDVALSIMIDNAAFDAIPQAVALNLAPGDNPLGFLSVRAMTKVRSRAAVPYFNPLLFNWNVGLRRTAVYALRDIDAHNDRSSIPYLTLTINDPDPDVAYSAYSQLSKRVPELGNPDDIPYWGTHRRAEIDRLLAWWQDEMDGKHHNAPSASEQAALIRSLQSAGKAGASREPVEVGLFSPAMSVRKAALTLLGKSPSVDDIPYLELTLRDPDAGVAYSAYTLLWRLLRLPRAAVPLAHFQTHWREDTDPERHWWWDELNAEHITDENLRRRMALPSLKLSPVVETHAGPGSQRDPQTNGPRAGKP